MNNYQAQQFWNDINGVIGFTTSIIFIGFMVGMTRNLLPSKVSLLTQSNKISDYEVTNKGLDYARKYDAKVHGQYSRYEVLETIWFQSKPSKEVINNTPRFIPELKELGYIYHIDYSLNELLDKIENPTIKRILVVYSKIAQESPVGDDEVDWVHNTLLDEFYSFSLRSYPKEGLTPVQRALLEVKTRSEKIIAIDSTLSVAHDTGYYLELVGAEKDYVIIGRILNRLAGE